MRIACDIDGVISDTSTMMREETAKLGYNIYFNQYTPSVEGGDDANEFISCLLSIGYKGSIFIGF